MASPPAPFLSVLTPFFHDDPTPLLGAIDRQAAAAKVDIELIAVDDGSGDDALADAVADCIRGLTAPACLMRFKSNRGRPTARNSLAHQARGRYLLFLDSDVAPAAETFLATYLDVIRDGDAAVVIGGYLTAPADRPEQGLHSYMAASFDCIPAAARQKMAWKYVYSSNVLIRRDAFDSAPFDEDYIGWGWEDQDWGMRLYDRWPILHIDNPVVHLGLDPDTVFLGKIAESVPGFARALVVHPQRIRSYPNYRAANLLRRLPFRGSLSSGARQIALTRIAPMALRGLAVRIYRALIYSQTLS